MRSELVVDDTLKHLGKKAKVGDWVIVRQVIFGRICFLEVEL